MEEPISQTPDPAGDREPTLDDVRGGENHYKLAVGCSAVIAILIVAFFVLRVALSR
jgi:hypothetical protein